MGNSSSTTTIPPNAPASPTILVSLSILPATITNSHQQQPSVPKLTITLTNPTTHAITFRHILTPLDVPRCFSDAAFSSLWVIEDVTDRHRSATIGRLLTATLADVVEVPIITEPTYHQPLLTPQHMRQSKDEDPKMEDFTTVMPGAKKTATLSFDMKILHGLEAGRKYAFRIREGGFDVPAEWWGWGKKDVVVRGVKERVQRTLRRRDAIEGWGVEENASMEAVDGSHDGTDGRGVLRFRCVEVGGAVLEVRHED